MCSPPNVVGMYMHSLRDKLDQGFSRPLMKTVRGVGYQEYEVLRVSSLAEAGAWPIAKAA